MGQGFPKEAVIAVLIGVLVLIAGFQTVQLIDLSHKAREGAITILPAGGLAERSSAAPAPSASSAGSSAGSCGG